MVPGVVQKLFDFLHQQHQIFQEYKLTGNERRCTLTLRFCHEDFLNNVEEAAVTTTTLRPEEAVENHIPLTVDTTEDVDQDQESDSGLQLSPNPVMRVPRYTRKKGEKDDVSSESENGMTTLPPQTGPFNFTFPAMARKLELPSEDTDASDNTDCDSDARSEDSFDVVSVVDPDEPSDEKLAAEATLELETSTTCHALYLKAQIAGLSAKARENIMDQTRNTKIVKRVYHFDGAMNTLTGVCEDVMIRLNIDSREASALGTLRKWALRETSNKTGWQEWYEGELQENRYTVSADDDRFPTASRKMEHILMNVMTKLREELR